MNTKRTQEKKSQQHSVPEPINNENADLKCGSDGIETEHLEGEVELKNTKICQLVAVAQWLSESLAVPVSPVSITLGVTCLKVL